MGCFVTNDRRKRGNWQGFFLFFTSFDGWISRSERGGFVWDWKWYEPFGNGELFWKLVNLVWTWLFLEFLINSVLIPSSIWIKKCFRNQQSMTEIIRVAERCARKNQTNLDSNSTQTSLKNVEKFGRRRVIEKGLKQVKLVNNSGFQVSFERWMKFDQKWSGFSWFEKVEFVSNSFSWQNWLKSDEKVRGCLFFGSKLFEIVEVFSSSWWIELLFRVRSGFKIKLFKVHEFVQVSTGTVFRTFQRF